MIKAIIFDFYGVIYSDDLWRYVGAHDELSGESRNVNEGRITWSEFREIISKRMRISLKQVDEMYESNRINRQLISLIISLKSEYKIGLLTDASKSHIEPLFRSIQADQLFDSITVSSDTGFTKPNPKAYLAALSAIDAAAQEAIFIDDASRNVEGAKAIGMQSLLFKDYNSLSNELKVLLGA